jgi:seryl-tRNA synthetase
MIWIFQMYDCFARFHVVLLQSNEQAKKYVHLLNSTLTATERTMCCILENYQKEDGVEVPAALREFMGGKSFLPFKNKPATEAKGKKPKA